MRTLSLPQTCLNPQQIASIKRFCPCEVEYRHILDQNAYPGVLPYSIELIHGGSAYLYKPELLKRLTEKGHVPDDSVRKFISNSNFRLSTRYKHLRCVIATPGDFNLTTIHGTEELYDNALRHDLILVRPDAALFAARQFHSGWTKASLVIFASNPISNNGLKMLGLSTRDGAASNLKGRIVEVIEAGEHQEFDVNQPFLFGRKD